MASLTCASCNQFVYEDALVGDAVLRPTNLGKSILFGTYGDRYSSLSLHSNIVRLTDPLAMSNAHGQVIVAVTAPDGSFAPETQALIDNTNAVSSNSTLWMGGHVKVAGDITIAGSFQSCNINLDNINSSAAFSSNAAAVSLDASTFASNNISFSSNAGAFGSNLIYSWLKNTNSNSMYACQVRTTVPLSLQLGAGYSNVVFDQTVSAVTTPEAFDHAPGSAYVRLASAGLYVVDTALQFAAGAAGSNARLSMQTLLGSNVIGVSQASVIASRPSGVGAGTLYSTGRSRFLVFSGASNGLLSMQARHESGAYSNASATLTAVRMNAATSAAGYAVLSNAAALALTTGFQSVFPSSNATIPAPGTYLVMSKVCCLSSNAFPAYVESYVANNGVEVPGSRFYTGTLDNLVANNNCINACLAYPLATNDVLTVQSRLIGAATTNAFTAPGLCHLSIVKLSNANVIQSSFSNAGAASNFSQRFAPIPINTTLASNAFGGTAYATSNAAIGLGSKAGWHLAIGCASFSNATGCTARWSVDGNPLPSTLAFATTSNAVPSLSIESLACFPAATTSIAVLDAAANAPAASASLVSSGCRATLLTIDTPTGTFNGTAIPLYGLCDSASLDASTFMTNASTFAPVLSLSTSYLAPGSYRLQYQVPSYVARCPTSNAFDLRVVLNNSSNVDSYTVFTPLYNLATSTPARACTLELGSNVHRLRLDARVYGSNDALIINNASIELSRIR